MTVYDPQQTPIAVVGVSAVFPGSVDKTGFWNDIVAGRDLVTDIPSSHWLIDDYFDEDKSAPDKTYAKRGAFLRDVPFDPLEWGVPPSIVPATDTTQLLALIVAKRVLVDALQNFDEADKDRTSVILGVTSAQELLGTMVSRLQRPVWVKALRELGYEETEVTEICDKINSNYVPWQESTFPGLLGNVVAGRIANRLDLGGTNCVTDAACASSFSAISMATNELWLGQSDMVVAGGCDTMNDIFMYMCFSKTPALSPTGECAPFSDRADGTLLGEGLGMVALKRLADAERDGDKVYAVLRGVGSSSDGRSKSVYAPVPKGQSKALIRAYEQAGYGPESVELVEAHGTGTKAGDAAEFGGLRLAFEASGREDRQWCALGTVKSQIGHTKAAAGAAGLFKVVMALHHKVLPPTIKIEQPNPKLEIESSPFHLNTVARPWIRSSDHPRRGSVSSFGFGGSNFHLTLEEYEGPARKPFRSRTSPTELVLLAADTPAALAAEARSWADRALAAGDGFLAYAARTTQEGFAHDKAARLAVVVKDEADLAAKLRQAADRITAAPDTPLSIPTGLHYAHGPADPGKVAFLFPGQGSQYLRMGADVAMAWDEARLPWDAAADHRFDGTALHEVVHPLPKFDKAADRADNDLLRSTEWAQPAIGLVSLSHLALMNRLGVSADMVAGHSYGEISALHAAGALSATDMLTVARKRGELMKEAAVLDGAMTAVPTDLETVRPYAAAVDGAVLANHNHHKQVVVSGPTPAIEQLEKNLLADGIEPKRLKVATAFHSPVVEGSVEPFATFLEGIEVAAPSIPCFHNPEAAPHGDDPATIRANLARAIARPVRFVEQIEKMYEAGVRTFVEVGPGHVLTNLVGEILGDRPHLAVNLDRRKKHGLTVLNNGLGRLALGGVALDFGALWADYEPAVDPASLPAPRMSLNIKGSNYGKPYPPEGGSTALPKPNTQRTGAAKARDPEPQVIEKVVEVEKIVEKTVHVPVAASGTGVAPAAPSAFQPHQPMAPAGAPADDAWVAAFQQVQQATVDAHASYQNAMAQSHMAFLQTVEASLGSLGAMMGGQPTASIPTQLAAMPMVAAAPVVPAAAAAPLFPSAAQAATEAPAPTWNPSPVASAQDVTKLVQSGLDVVRPAASPAAPAAPAAPTAPVAQAAAVDLEALLMDVVADKTGYPAEMLGAHMSLEGDLGIDSIKRVEILSAMRERAPQLPEVDAGEMASLQTLGQIVEHMQAQLGTIAPPVTAAAAAPAASVDLNAVLMSVVADKTGYPAEMLAPHMNLESDLGIDSIKRVEILSAMREKAPGLPEVDASEMASLQTLGQIVDHMQAQLGTVAAPAAAPAAAAPAAAVDLHGLLMDVVADKTGYPADMLALHMNLESDLGIDSIKRVEILSAMREKAPELPEVDASEMASLQTLGQIVDHMQAQLGTVAAPIASAAAAAPSIDLHGLLMDVVADKTGYPADMLAPHMNLESDLGIDSIKRVEILSAMREQAPELPEVDAGAMASLQTLGQIVDYMQDQLGGAPAAPVADAPPATAAPALELGRWALDVVETKAAGLSQPGLGPDARIEVLGDDAVAPALVTALRGRGLDAHGVDTVTADATAVVYTGGLRADVSAADAVAAEAFRAARTVAPRFTDGHGLFVTVQDTGGRFAPADERAWFGGLPGLVKTAAQEWNASTKAIDLERGDRSADDLARALVDELFAGGPELEVGLAADGTRFTLRSVRTDAAATEPSTGADSVIVATGGARGVTAATLVRLAEVRGGAFALLGRTPLEDEPVAARGVEGDAKLKGALLSAAKASGTMPSPAELGKQVRRILAGREVRATLSAIEAAGGKAIYVPCDVSDAQATGAALQSVRDRLGPITALVHGAGVLADKFIADKTDDQFSFVYGVKVGGLRTLLGALADDPLTAIVTFSSVAGRCGNQGQCDYAMANEVLNKVAVAEAARRGGDVVVKSLGWGPWEGGMVTPQLKARFESLGVPLIPLAAGAQMLVDDLADRSGAVEVVLGGEPKMGPLAAAHGERRCTLRVHVGEGSHPYLADHTIADVPVVPMVLAVEWMARAAAACRPDLALQSLSDVAVNRGIKLEQFRGSGHWFDVVAREVSNGTGSVLSVQITDLDGRPHYSASATLGSKAPSAPTAPAELSSLGEFSGSIYDGHVLFHGRTFQVIGKVEGISDEGLVASSVTTTHDAGWSDEAWRTDPAAWDGGLQMALLWSRHVLGGASIPMKLGSVHSYTEGPAQGPVRAALTGAVRGRDKTVTDIVFTDSDGTVVAELRGVEAILRPGEPATA